MAFRRLRQSEQGELPAVFHRVDNPHPKFGVRVALKPGERLVRNGKAEAAAGGRPLERERRFAEDDRSVRRCPLDQKPYERHRPLAGGVEDAFFPAGRQDVPGW